MLALTKRAKLCGGRVDFSMALQAEKQTKYRRSILKRTVSVIKFITECVRACVYKQRSDYWVASKWELPWDGGTADRV